MRWRTTFARSHRFYIHTRTRMEEAKVDDMTVDGQLVEEDDDMLPVELLMAIASFAGPRTLVNAKRTCRMLYQVASDATLWASIVRATLSRSPTAATSPIDNALSIFPRSPVLHIDPIDLECLGRDWEWLYRACSVSVEARSHGVNGPVLGFGPLHIYVRGDVPNDVPEPWSVLPFGNDIYVGECTPRSAEDAPTPYQILSGNGESGYLPHGAGVHWHHDTLSQALHCHIGHWHRGSMVGHGRIKVDTFVHDGATHIYTGDIADSVPHGHGRLVVDVPNGTMDNARDRGHTVERYEGAFVYGVRTGHGVHWVEGSHEHVGAWSNDKMHGPGRVRMLSQKDVAYECTWMAGKMDGILTIHGPTYTEQYTYSNGVRNGPCCRTTDGGYAAEYAYVGGQVQPRIRICHPDGDVYEGGYDYATGTMHGEGTTTFAAGHVQTGIWKHDVPVGVHCIRMSHKLCRHTHHSTGASTVAMFVRLRHGTVNAPPGLASWQSRHYDLSMPNGDVIAVRAAALCCRPLEQLAGAFARQQTAALLAGADDDNDPNAGVVDDGTESTVCYYRVADACPVGDIAGRTLVWECRQKSVSPNVGDVFPHSLDSEDARAWVRLVESGWACVSQMLVDTLADVPPLESPP